MNKKFLSAILFGALMVSSTGTFVSCKDYDDDISELWNAVDGQKTDLTAKVTAVESSISSLQTAQTALDSKIAAVQDAAEKAALEAQKAAIAAAAEELAAVRADLQKAIDANAKDAETLKAAVTKAEEGIAEAVGRIQTLEAFKTTTVETLAKLGEADATLTASIKALDSKVAENAIQIGKNKAAIEAQIEALNNYKTSNGEAISQIIEDLKTLEAGQLTEAKVTEIAEQVTEKVGAKLDLISAAFNKKVTHVSLVTNNVYEGSYNFLDLVSAKAVTNTTFGAGLEGEIKFKKDYVETFEDQFLIRVSPTNAVLDKDMIKLVNSQLGDLAGLVDIKSIEPYKGLLTRGVSENGLWTVTVKLIDNFDMDAYAAAAIAENKRYINYAVMVGDSLKDERQIVSEYGLCLSTWERETRHELNFYVDKNNVNDIKNRWDGAKPTYTENGGVADYVEKAWNLKHHFVQVDREWVYDYADFADPVWDKNAANYNLAEAIASSEKSIEGISVADVRNDKVAYRVKAGTPFTVSFGNYRYGEDQYDYIDYTNSVRGYYVTLDEQCAVESEPSEINAWKSYKIQGLDKVVKGTEALELTIPEGVNADGDYIGFRVYAVNYDGSLLDPDGKAFYVYVGDLNEETADLTLSMDALSVPYANLGTMVATPDNAFKPFVTSGWSKAQGGTYELVIRDGNGEVVTTTGVNYSNFVFKNKNNAVIYPLQAGGRLINAATIADAKTIGMTGVTASNLKDGMTYTATLIIKSQHAAVLATATITFAKELPGFPTNVVPFTNMMQNKNVMVFPTPVAGNTGLAEYDLKKAWHNISNGTPAVGYAQVDFVDLSEPQVVDYAPLTNMSTLDSKYVDPSKTVYATKFPMEIAYNYGEISYAYDAYTQSWDVKDHVTKYNDFTLQFANYINECTATLNNVSVNYPGARDKTSTIELSKLSIKDWYNEAVTLTKYLTADTKEYKYIQTIKAVNFLTENAGKPVDEYYEFAGFGKADSKGNIVLVGEDFKTYNSDGSVKTTVTLELKDATLIVMKSTSDASTGAAVPTKIQITIEDKFGFDVKLTTTNSFDMKFQQ